MNWVLQAPIENVIDYTSYFNATHPEQVLLFQVLGVPNWNKKLIYFINILEAVGI